MIINELIGDRKLEVVAIYLAVLLLTPLLHQVLNSIICKKIIKISISLHIQTTTDFYRYITQLDHEFRENPKIKVKEDIAREMLENATSTIDSFFELISAFIKIIAIISIVSTLNPFVAFIIFVLVLINTIVTRKINEKRNALDPLWYKLQRYINMYEMPIIQVYYAKDVYLFNLVEYFIKKYTDKRKEADAVVLKKDEYKRFVDVFLSFSNVLQGSILYAYMIYNVLVKNMLIGSMTIFSNAAYQFSGALGGLFNQYVAMSNNNIKIDETIQYMNLPVKMMSSGNKQPIFDKNTIIEFKNVSFKYPGNDNLVLYNINITLRGNEKLCIIGKNGAGKSTLIKLLLRMYSPTEGIILLNGVDINEYDYLEYWKLFSPVFQDFNLFGGLSIKDNIILSDSYEQSKFNTICANSGISSLIEKLPKGSDTPINKWVDEDGVVPSGGEGQRIAIARACYHGGEIYLLDEPTAALDPIAEYEIYTQFNNMIHDKCAVLITHRLSAVQLADKVAVFDNGSVVEYGTHRELYVKGGIYTEMFDKQAQFYRDEPKIEII